MADYYADSSVLVKDMSTRSGAIGFEHLLIRRLATSLLLRALVL
jgi:hypothetical protein